jgi:modulator of FtsH protease HflK
MAWNEPGKDQNPWGNRGKNDGPPDLDEAFRKLQDKLNGLFGGGNKGNNSGGSSGIGGLLVVVAVILVVVWAGLGIYQVDAKERAVILRFGAFYDIEDEGLKWRMPLIDEVIIESTTSTRQYANTAKSLMLTKDESIVELPLAVQYNISDVKKFVLNVRDPEISLQHATDSAVRHVVGSTELNQVLSEGREAIAVEVKQRLQSYLDLYESGIQVVSVNIQESRPPEEVRAAFDDVIRAKEDEQRSVNQAQSYSNGVVNEAKGNAQRLLAEAEGYKSAVISRAQGESSRFESLLAEYKRAPEVTRQRLYLETMENVMSSSSKVMVDVKGGNNMMYLPLDKILSNTTPNRTNPVQQSGSTVIETSAPATRREMR